MEGLVKLFASVSSELQLRSFSVPRVPNVTFLCHGIYDDDLWSIMLTIVNVVFVYLSGAEVKGFVKLLASSRRRQYHLVTVPSVQSPPPPHNRTNIARARPRPPARTHSPASNRLSHRNKRSFSHPLILSLPVTTEQPKIDQGVSQTPIRSRLRPFLPNDYQTSRTRTKLDC
ncbi:hypothetical protein DPMN_059800 [Dreissena polymorpha]|uniref:Uncharacterized protein n=1 Tax=Dreissena polymorpha TaxID=45954 RepID=A0A9D4C427_DREPO|nr:hypothetical protein DPMN_059800 [Dreissena polymorpha]